MNMLTTPPRPDTAIRMGLPGLFADTTVQDRPTLVWHIDCTSGRAVSNWMMLPKRPALS